MTADACDRISFADLVDYAAGELPEFEVAAIEEHLFSCAGCSARAAEVETLAAGIAAAARAADVGGFVTDAVLNRLSRDGVRVRTFALSPGAAVPCAVWDDDELMVLRLRADFGSAREVTLSQRVGGSEVVRVTAPMDPSQREILHATPAAIVRQLPAADVEVFLTTSTDGEQRTIGSCTLVHGGSLHRR